MFTRRVYRLSAPVSDTQTVLTRWGFPVRVPSWGVRADFAFCCMTLCQKCSGKEWVPAVISLSQCPWQLGQLTDISSKIWHEGDSVNTPACSNANRWLHSSQRFCFCLFFLLAWESPHVAWICVAFPFMTSAALHKDILNIHFFQRHNVPGPCVAVSRHKRHGSV